MSLAFSIPFKAYRFNVGIEGQFLLGATGAALVGIYIGSLTPISFMLCLLVGSIMGLLWSSAPALLLYFFRANEIVTTLLMNFISFYLVDLIATGQLRDIAAGHPMTIPIAPQAALPLISIHPRITIAPLITILLTFSAYIFMYKTIYGYELRAVGSNRRAAMIYGISLSRLEPLSIILSGLLAGIAGSIEVTGLHMRLISGMQSNYVMIAILSTLLAKGHPLLLLISSAGISVIEVGSSALQRTSRTPAELSLLIEGTLLLSILLFEAPKYLKLITKQREPQHG
jgi:simple sugar transport system permease protein